MKRTDKYRDSYKYDNQYQNHRRRAEEDEFRNRAQSPNKMNGQRSNQREFEDEPERYYNGRDYRREQQLEEENEKSGRTKKWLIAIIVILLIIVAIFVTRAIMNHNDDKVNNDPNVSQNYKKQVESQNDYINKQVDSAKSDIKNNKNSESQISKLQNEIDKLKQKEENNADSKFTQFYQKQLDKLKNANNAQQNNENQSKINSMLEDINTKFDSIKSKLESILNGSSSDGQSN